MYGGILCGKMSQEVVRLTCIFRMTPSRNAWTASPALAIVELSHGLMSRVASEAKIKGGAASYSLDHPPGWVIRVIAAEMSASLRAGNDVSSYRVRYPICECRAAGGLAQLGERRVRNAEVEGSNPLPSTRPKGILPTP